ncbi:hypothetical protein TrLO_g11772 [Triparma laevis f. longispina]|uniref:LamG-like jellyroll fold domain-containing protein n=1 Tax=Triparma laevis f. longispina TaxID=1714387 RepID=A0A9W7ARH8_9STRA|nr:hypothetical protein TrLO_g11772 [Triparma laevis f. longispina]
MIWSKPVAAAKRLYHTSTFISDKKRQRGSNTTQTNNKKTSTTEAAVAKFQTGLVLTEARREEILRMEENATALQKVNSDLVAKVAEEAKAKEPLLVVIQTSADKLVTVTADNKTLQDRLLLLLPRSSLLKVASGMVHDIYFLAMRVLPDSVSCVTGSDTEAAAPLLTELGLTCNGAKGVHAGGGSFVPKPADGEPVHVGPLSCSILVYIKDHTTWGKFVQHYSKVKNGKDNRFMLCGGLTADTNNLYFIVWRDGVKIYVKSEVVLPMRRWVHLAATVEGKVMKLFIDGELQGSTNNGHEPLVLSTTHFSLGAGIMEGASNGGNTIEGSIGSYSLFNRALSENEVKAMAKFQLSHAGVPQLAE